MTMHEGGCLCGAVRYRVEAEFKDVGYCHCRMCQRSAGAPVMAWDTVPAAAMAWTRGEPRAYRSSERSERLFCPDCGTQLVFRNAGEGTFDINTVFAGIVVLTVFALVLDAVVGAIERRLMTWQPKTSETEKV